MNIYDISRRAGVSIATVSRVLNCSPHVSQKTKERVLAVIEEAGYVPNAFARGLGLNSMQTVGLLCPNAADPYLSQALTYLERGFRSHGYDCLLACTGKELEARAAGVKAMKDRHVDGLVMMGSTFVETSERGNHYLRQAASTMPVVLLNGHYPCENVYCVLCDDRRATAEAAQFLLDGGRKRILYLYHSRNFSGKRKLQGYLDALESRGLSPDERLMRYYSEDKMSVVQVRDFLLELDAEGLRFDAVLTSEDLLGVGAVKYARAKGLSVPGDLSIVGYNNSHLCLCSEPELTSVDNKLQALCAHCVATMLGALQGRVMPQLTVFAADLVRRGSTLG